MREKPIAPPPACFEWGRSLYAELQPFHRQFCALGAACSCMFMGEQQKHQQSKGPTTRGWSSLPECSSSGGMGGGNADDGWPLVPRIFVANTCPARRERKTGHVDSLSPLSPKADRDFPPTATLETEAAARGCPLPAAPMNSCWRDAPLRILATVTTWHRQEAGRSLASENWPPRLRSRDHFPWKASSDGARAVA